MKKIFLKITVVSGLLGAMFALKSMTLSPREMIQQAGWSMVNSPVNVATTVLAGGLGAGVGYGASLLAKGLAKRPQSLFEVNRIVWPSPSISSIDWRCLLQDFYGAKKWILAGTGLGFLTVGIVKMLQKYRNYVPVSSMLSAGEGRQEEAGRLNIDAIRSDECDRVRIETKENKIESFEFSSEDVEKLRKTAQEFQDELIKKDTSLQDVEEKRRSSEAIIEDFLSAIPRIDSTYEDCYAWPLEKAIKIVKRFAIDPRTELLPLFQHNDQTTRSLSEESAIYSVFKKFLNEVTISSQEDVDKYWLLIKKIDTCLKTSEEHPTKGIEIYEVLDYIFSFLNNNDSKEKKQLTLSLLLNRVVKICNLVDLGLGSWMELSWMLSHFDFAEIKTKDVKKNKDFKNLINVLHVYFQQLKNGDSSTDSVLEKAYKKVVYDCYSKYKEWFRPNEAQIQLLDSDKSEFSEKDKHYHEQNPQNLDHVWLKLSEFLSADKIESLKNEAEILRDLLVKNDISDTKAEDKVQASKETIKAVFDVLLQERKPLELNVFKENKDNKVEIPDQYSWSLSTAIQIVERFKIYQCKELLPFFEAGDAGVMDTASPAYFVVKKFLEEINITDEADIRGYWRVTRVIDSCLSIKNGYKTVGTEVYHTFNRLFVFLENERSVEEKKTKLNVILGQVINICKLVDKGIGSWDALICTIQHINLDGIKGYENSNEFKSLVNQLHDFYLTFLLGKNIDATAVGNKFAAIIGKYSPSHREWFLTADQIQQQEVEYVKQSMAAVPSKKVPKKKNLEDSPVVAEFKKQLRKKFSGVSRGQNLDENINQLVLILNAVSSAEASHKKWLRKLPRYVEMCGFENAIAQIKELSSNKGITVKEVDSLLNNEKEWRKLK